MKSRFFVGLKNNDRIVCVQVKLNIEKKNGKFEWMKMPYKS